MEEDWCYICMENENQEYKFLQDGICQCKNMKIHNKCFFLLKEKYKCSVCKSVYENFTVKQDNKLLIFRKYGITEQYYINQSNRKEGLYILKLYDSRILLHCFYKDGVRNGLYQEFYQNTQIKNFGYYIEGKKHGIHLCWYPGNKLKDSCEYLFGIPNGIHNYYSNENKPIIKSVFDKGKLNGSFTLYHPNGKIWVHCNFKSDLQDGIFKEYDSKGFIISDLIFKDGNFIGFGAYFTIINFVITYQIFIRLFGFLFFLFFF